MSDTELLRRIDRIESYQAIQQLPIRYAIAVDSRDLDAWVNLFVEDVQVDRSISSTTITPPARPIAGRSTRTATAGS